MSIDDLIEMKERAGRQQDLFDVQELRNIEERPFKQEPVSVESRAWHMSAQFWRVGMGCVLRKAAFRAARWHMLWSDPIGLALALHSAGAAFFGAEGES